MIKNFPLIILLACGRVEDPYSPVYETYPEFKVRHIQVDTTVTYLMPQDYESFDYTTESLGAIHLILTNDDQIYTVDNRGKSVRRHDSRTLEVTESFQFLGRGPGEYLEIGAISQTDSVITVFDRMQNKLIRFDSSFRHLSDFFIPGIQQKSDHIVTVGQSILYSTSWDEIALIGAYDVADSSQNQFHPPTIRRGFEPKLYNNRIIAFVNERLTVASVSMPLLFIYEMNGSDPEPVALLRLQAPFLEMVGKPMRSDAGFGSTLIANPPPVEIKLDASKVVGMSPVFQRVRMWGDYIFLQEPQEHSLIVLKRKKKTYSHHLRIRLADDAREIVRWSEFQIRYPYVYLASYAENKIYRFELSKLEE